MPETKTETDDSIPAVGYSCFRCGKPGHGYAECVPPAAETETELRDRIAHYIELVIAGRISTTRKRDWVKQEWAKFNDLQARKREKKYDHHLRRVR